MFGLSLNLGSRRSLAAALTDTEQVAALGPVVLWDINDLSTVYEDDARTTLATVNGSVGGVEDQSGNGHHLSQATAANKPTLRGTPTGANLHSAYGTPGAGWVDSGGGVATATTSSAGMPAGVTPTAAKVYRIQYTVTRTAGSVTASIGGVSDTARSAAGTYTFYATAASTAELTFTGASFSGTIAAVVAYDVSADSVEAPYSLHFDGSNDYLTTGSVDFSGTDAVTVCAAIRVLSAGSTATVIALSSSPGATNGTFQIQAPSPVANTLRFSSKGDQPIRNADQSSVTAPYSAQVTGTADISADSVVLRRDGSTITTNASDQGAGNYRSDVLYLGSGTTSGLRFNGLIGRTGAFDSVLAGADLTLVETWADAGKPT